MSMITCDCLHVTINQILVTFFLLLYACIHPPFPDTEGGNMLLLYKNIILWVASDLEQCTYVHCTRYENKYFDKNIIMVNFLALPPSLPSSLSPFQQPFLHHTPHSNTLEITLIGLTSYSVQRKEGGYGSSNSFHTGDKIQFLTNQSQCPIMAIEIR